MACPTCDCTLQKIDTEGIVFWCPRCGTLVEHRGYMGKEYVNADAPKLVDHCRGFERMVHDPGLLSALQTLGISESINIPANRKT